MERRRMSAPAASWDHVLRGLVSEAFDVRGTADSRRAYEAITRGWAVWPLAEALPALKAGEGDVASTVWVSCALLVSLLRP
jgi:hypothetical protein